MTKEKLQKYIKPILHLFFQMLQVKISLFSPNFSLKPPISQIISDKSQNSTKFFSISKIPPLELNFLGKRKRNLRNRRSLRFGRRTDPAVLRRGRSFPLQTNREPPGTRVPQTQGTSYRMFNHDGRGCQVVEFLKVCTTYH